MPSSKIYKNFNINMGVPFQVDTPVFIKHIKKTTTGYSGQDFHESTKHSHPRDNFEDENGEYDLSSEFSPEIQEALGAADDIIKQAKAEAEDIIKQAYVESQSMIDDANQLIEQAEQQSNEIREKAYEDGYEQAKLQYEDLLDEANAEREKAREEYFQIMKSIESDIIHLAMEVARKVVSIELSTSNEAILEITRDAISKCSVKENIVIRVSGNDYEFALENIDKISSFAKGVGYIEIKKDTSLESGGVIVETAFGSIDASTDTRLAKIEQYYLSLR